MISLKTKILIDTDIGDDIDDALAIAMALKSPELDIVGITTVFKNTEMRTALTLALLKKYNRLDIPVHTGIGTPMINIVDTQEIPPQCAVLSDLVPHRNELHAVDFIIKTVKEQPDTVIVPIGAQTNIAVAILKAPEVMKNAKIVCMGGVFSEQYPEWNILCDPEAARIVAGNINDYTMIGLDVTTKCVLNKEHIDQIKAITRDEIKFLYSLIEKWFDSSGHRVTLHDPLVIGYLIDNDLLKTENAHIHVELAGEMTRAFTIRKTNPFVASKECISNIKIATEVNDKRFVDLFMNRVFYN